MTEHIIESEMVTLDRDGEVFILTMVDGENRWNTSFTRAMDAALDAIDATDGPAALVTTSADPKFFSNGLDLDWVTSEGEHRGGDRSVFGREFMAFMARVITFGVPTVAAINGHAFGAGLMLSMCHDVRVMREDRGFLCANEMDLGMAIPHAELALFRHKLSMPVFFETVQLARRWTGPAALEAGMVQHVAAQTDTGGRHLDGGRPRSAGQGPPCSPGARKPSSARTLPSPGPTARPTCCAIPTSTLVSPRAEPETPPTLAGVERFLQNTRPFAGQRVAWFALGLVIVTFSLSS
ncbi:MAG: enoyl-CoA hydratase-related protein [Acidimicrobiales bacterium]